jgi:hypothetical protein
MLGQIAHGPKQKWLRQWCLRNWRLFGFFTSRFGDNVSNFMMPPGPQNAMDPFTLPNHMRQHATMAAPNVVQHSLNQGFNPQGLPPMPAMPGNGMGRPAMSLPPMGNSQTMQPQNAQLPMTMFGNPHGMPQNMAPPPQFNPQSSGVAPNGVNQLNALTGGAYGGSPQPAPALGGLGQAIMQQQAQSGGFNPQFQRLF